MGEPKKRNRRQADDAALAAIERLGVATIAEVAEALGINYSYCRRIVVRLHRQGSLIAERDPERRNGRPRSLFRRNVSSLA